ncbi:MAG: putative sulfate exporter family transporter, partial [Sphingomonadales bacterium]|nr:putative sulfate exporter family transporter [Sphingomonadales bacterium]
LINTLGLFGTLFLGPGASLLGMDATEKAVLMGSLLQSVGHVSAAASGLGEEPALLAISLKMGRILLLIPLLLWFQSFRSPDNTKQPATDSPFSKILTLVRGVPHYVGGFVLCALATNLVHWPDWFLSSIKNLTQWMLWIALAAIGMNIRISQVLHQGHGALVQALGMFVIQILLVLGWLVFLKL